MSVRATYRTIATTLRGRPFEAFIDTVFERAKVSKVVMTNDPFDSADGTGVEIRGYWRHPF